MSDSTGLGLASAASLSLYFLPRQPNKLDYKPLSPVRKGKATEFYLDLVCTSSRRGAGD
jgi:hypothetical protein